MPILVTLVACVVIVILQVSTMDFFGQQTKTYQLERERFIYTEAVRSAGSAVREAAELWIRQVNTGTAVCPPGTSRKQAKLHGGGTVDLCWRSLAGDGECIQSREGRTLWVCPMQSGAIFAWQGWERLLFSSANAAPITIQQLNPQPTSVNGGGVRINVAACGAGGPCIRCQDVDTTCITITFCVSKEKKFSCSGEEKVVQTFAFRK